MDNWRSGRGVVLFTDLFKSSECVLSLSENRSAERFFNQHFELYRSAILRVIRANTGASDFSGTGDGFVVALPGNRSARAVQLAWELQCVADNFSNEYLSPTGRVKGARANLAYPFDLNGFHFRTGVGVASGLVLSRHVYPLALSEHTGPAFNRAARIEKKTRTDAIFSPLLDGETILRVKKMLLEKYTFFDLGDFPIDTKPGRKSEDKSALQAGEPIFSLVKKDHPLSAVAEAIDHAISLQRKYSASESKKSLREARQLFDSLRNKIRSDCGVVVEDRWKQAIDRISGQGTRS